MPEPGSLREVVCILVQRYRQEQQFNALLATVAGDPERKKEAMMRYLDALAPYISSTRRDEVGAAAAVMNKFMQDGPLVLQGGLDE